MGPTLTFIVADENSFAIAAHARARSFHYIAMGRAGNGAGEALRRALMTELDDALARQAGFGPEYGAAGSSHVPMVLEALDRLGRRDVMAGYVDAWLPKLRVLSTEREPELAAFPELLREMRGRVHDDGPDGALVAALPRVRAGLVGAAYHGLLRVAHAVRSVHRVDTPARREELAAGLAYAITRVAPKLAAPVAVADGAVFSDELAAVDASPVATRGRKGLITPDLLARINEGDFLEVACARVHVSSDLHEALRDLRRAANRLYVASDVAPGASFVLLHGVTAVDAVVSLVPHVGAQAMDLVRDMATSLVALRVAYVSRVEPSRVTELEPGPPHASRVAAAVATNDDHAIKLAAACVEGAKALPLEPWDAVLAQGLA